MVGTRAPVDYRARKRGTVETLDAFPETSSAVIARCIVVEFGLEVLECLVLYVRNMERHFFPVLVSSSRSGFSETERAESGLT